MSENTNSTTGMTGQQPTLALANVPTTKILAIGRITSKGTLEARDSVMPFEVHDTVRLYLAGKIDQWFFQTDGSGVVFHINVTTPAEARELLEKLPLRKAGMMEFELIPLGPLRALGFLLAEPSSHYLQGFRGE